MLSRLALTGCYQFQNHEQGTADGRTNSGANPIKTKALVIASRLGTPAGIL